MSLTKKIIIGNCTLYLGRCEDILPTLESESIDAVITDPPYQYLKHKLDIPFDYVFVFNEWSRLVKNNRLITFFGRGLPLYQWIIYLNDVGFNYKEDCVWDKKRTPNIFNNLLRRHENFIIMESGKAKLNKCYVDFIEYNQDDVAVLINFIKRLKTDLINNFDIIKDYVKDMKITTMRQVAKHRLTGVACSNATHRVIFNIDSIKKGSVQNTIFKVSTEHYTYEHPTQKPVALIERIINLTTKPNQVVLDCFMGSGTTGVACIKNGRKFIGVECDAEYFDISVRRIKDAYNLKKEQSELF